jgi:hypothetical protein
VPANTGGRRWAILVLAPGLFLGAAAMLALGRDFPTGHKGLAARSTAG